MARAQAGVYPGFSRFGKVFQTFCNWTRCVPVSLAIPMRAYGSSLQLVARGEGGMEHRKLLFLRRFF